MIQSVIDYLLICTGCWIIGGDYGIAAWFICSAFYKGHV